MHTVVIPMLSNMCVCVCICVCALMYLCPMCVCVRVRLRVCFRVRLVERGAPQSLPLIESGTVSEKLLGGAVKKHEPACINFTQFTFLFHASSLSLSLSLSPLPSPVAVDSSRRQSHHCEP